MNNLIEYINYAYTTKLLLIVVGLFSGIFAFRSNLHISDNKPLVSSVLLMTLLIWRIGCQPIGIGSYGDREIYAISYINTNEYTLDFSQDWLLGAINYALHPIFDVESYFVIIACIYVGLYCIVAFRLSKFNSYWMLIAIALSFGFTSYGYNTMRAGLATSLILLGITFYKKTLIAALFIFLGIGTHFSMIIPVTAFIFSYFYPKTKFYFYLWLLSIPLSFVAGNYFNVIFSSLSGDHRTNYLTTLNDYYNIGFRFDFIVYSLVPMVLGAYYIFKRNFTDKMYVIIYNTYILANIFWILVIRANFSDRFAYLSWFLLPIILVYPLLSDTYIVRQPGKWLGCILLGEVMFKFLV